MTPAIRVENLGKRYRIDRAAPRGRYRTVRETLVNLASAPLRRFRRGAGTGEDFWALKDVNFEVQPGEVVGIIGRNGAGKSTLLKILSRITKPQTGQVRLHGRVASLLEVGTGFHPELSGRENIYLNGSILGMRRAEIKRKFDEIIAFAEVDRFLDLPVKRYSSGMYVRLAFSVAAHLDPEILIIDEVLAVGDADFQRKCMQKMEHVAHHSGRTVLFVSHNTGAVRAICGRAIMLARGEIAADGAADEVVGAYSASLAVSAKVDVASRTDRRGTGAVRLIDVRVSNGDFDRSDNLRTGGPAKFVFTIDRPIRGLACRFSLLDSHGNVVSHFNSSTRSPDDLNSSSQDATFICRIDELLLGPGIYRLNVALMMSDEILDHVESARQVSVEAGEVRGRIISERTGVGIACLPHRWTTPS